MQPQPTEPPHPKPAPAAQHPHTCAAAGCQACDTWEHGCWPPDLPPHAVHSTQPASTYLGWAGRRVA